MASPPTAAVRPSSDPRPHTRTDTAFFARVTDDSGAEIDPVTFLRAAIARVDPAAAVSHATTDLAAIARTLGHNALALSLAAEKLVLISPRELLPLLERRLDVLTSRHHPDRSLRDAIAPIWAALSDTERHAAAALALLAGPFTLAEATVVLGSPATAAALDVLERLAEQGVVGHAPTAPVGDGPARFVTEPNIAAYARDHAQQADHDDDGPRRRHLTVVHARLAGLRVPRALTPLDHAAIHVGDDDPVGHAIAETFAAGAHTPGAAAALVMALGALLRVETILNRALPLVTTTAAATADPGPCPDTLIRARCLVAEALYLHGRAPEARALLAADPLAAANPVHAALLASALGASHFYGAADIAVPALEDALEILDQAGDPQRIATRMRIARAAENCGDLRTAIHHYEAVLAIAAGGHDPHQATLAHLNLGALEAHLGRDPWRHYRAALAGARQTGDAVAEAVTLVNLGLACFQAGNDGDANCYFGASQTIAEAVGLHRTCAVASIHAGILAHCARHMERAEALYRAGLDACARAWRDPLLSNLGRLGLVSLAVDRRAMPTAQHLLAGIEADAADNPTPALEALLGLAMMVANRDAHDSHAGRRAIAAAQAARMAGAALPRRGAAEIATAFRILGIAGDGARPAVIRVEDGGRTCVTPDGTVIQLGRRGPARLVLLALANAAATAPGVCVDFDTLVAAAWPGETVQPPYDRSRIHVVIADLRKLGLERWLVHDGDGYALTVPASVVGPTAGPTAEPTPRS